MVTIDTMKMPACRLAVRDPRSPRIYRSLTDPHFPRIPWKRGRCPASEAEVNRHWRLELEKDAPEMVRVAAWDFSRFLAESFGIVFSKNTHKTGRIQVRIDPSVRTVSKRDHRIEIARDRIEVIGVSEWGTACGLYHLQRLMRLNRAPRLACGVIHAALALDPSLTHLAFKQGNMSNLNYPEAYHENYLVRIARAGYTGFHLDLDLGFLCQSKILPELNDPKAARNLATLRDIVARSRRCALDVHVVLYLHPLAPDHPVFRHHPDLAGSEILFTHGRRILCGSHPLARRFYEEQAARLVRETRLAGLILIVGCEGLLHCYTAPVARPRNQTDCLRCGKKDPEQTVAYLVNGIAHAVKQERCEARVAVWPYCSGTWTKTPNAKDLVSKLSADCDFLGNFDTGDRCQRKGVEAVFTDYSLTNVGPSADFRSQAAAAKRRGLKVLAKLESGCPRDIHNVPSIPANTRWARKYANVLESGVSGAMFAWEFTGYTEEIAGELAGWMSWRPCLPARELLRRLAARDFGARNAAGVLKAWRWFDRAMDWFPFSGFTTHFARGSFFIGFTHPLIFDPHRPGELSPQFWLHSTRMLFNVDLQWTHPFGAANCLRTLRQMEQRWDRGCRLLERIRSPGRKNSCVTAKQIEHQALGRGILCTLRTAINLIRFHRLRDQYFHEASNLRLVRRRLTALRDIAKEELANAEEGLACMQRNPRIGHDYVNGVQFTEEMAQSKIAHTRQIIDEVLPLRMFTHSFSMFARDETLRDDGRKWR
ncbi:MAG: hypothetical protein HY360_09650 [Verrucomicrobia bacterium]|nr:hypothetical protein [Verrucomicrobiota bacterium]